VSLFNFFGNMVITVHAIDSLHLNLVVWSLLLAMGNTTLRGPQLKPCYRKTTVTIQTIRKRTANSPSYDEMIIVQLEKNNFCFGHFRTFFLYHSDVYWPKKIMAIQ
jgi:hypothetical protein